jgi:hypothetical protein
MPRKMAREPKTINSQADRTAETSNPPTAPTKASKIDLIRAQLRRDQGATLAELIEATGWLPHTTRAALTGLKKKGVTLEKSKRGDATCYRIVDAAR